MKIVGIIPARYYSTRLPGKPLAMIQGKPMVQHVYERAREAQNLDALYVATDTLLIFETVQAFGGEAILTREDHETGTDRLAEVSETLDLGTDDIVVNIQGDEPLVQPRMIEVLVDTLVKTPAAPMATLAFPSSDEDEYLSSHVVKVVTDRKGMALYFSRSPIPFRRDPSIVFAGPESVPSDGASTPSAPEQTGNTKAPSQPVPSGCGFLKHLGYYAYRAPFLRTFTGLPQTQLERTEKLEQLRALEHGYPIVVAISPCQTLGVDTPEDLEKVIGHLTCPLSCPCDAG